MAACSWCARSRPQAQLPPPPAATGPGAFMYAPTHHHQPPPPPPPLTHPTHTHPPARRRTRPSPRSRPPLAASPPPSVAMHGMGRGEGAQAVTASQRPAQLLQRLQSGRRRTPGVQEQPLVPPPCEAHLPLEQEYEAVDGPAHGGGGKHGATHGFGVSTGREGQQAQKGTAARTAAWQAERCAAGRHGASRALEGLQRVLVQRPQLLHLRVCGGTQAVGWCATCRPATALRACLPAVPGHTGTSTHLHALDAHAFQQLTEHPRVALYRAPRSGGVRRGPQREGGRLKS